MISEEASGDLEKQTLSSGEDEVKRSETSAAQRRCCSCWRLLRSVKRVRSLPVEEDDEVDPQSVVAFNLATTLYIFVYYLQVLGIVVSDLIVDLPELWEALFGWVRFPALTALFPQFEFASDWEKATVALFALYMIPVYLYIMFTLALNVYATCLEESTTQLKYMGMWTVVAAGCMAGGFFAPNPFDALLVVFAAYGFMIALYWAIKWVCIELIVIPMGEKRGTPAQDTRFSTQAKEIWLLQFVWLTTFAPIVSGWAFFGLFNANLIVVIVGGVSGLVVVLYMLMFIICLAHNDIHVDSKYRSKYIDAFDRHFVSRNQLVPRQSVQTLTRPFKTWSWWFQALFMIERMILVLIGAAIPNITGGPVTLGIVVVFSGVVVFLLPYLGKAENIQDVVSRLSNTVILGLGIASSYSEEWRNIIGIIMCTVSFLTALFWIYYFRPVILAQILLEDIKFFVALSRWNRKFRFKTVRSHLKSVAYKIKSYEWEALTKKQRVLTMCVVRPEVDESRRLAFIQLKMNSGDLEYSLDSLDAEATKDLPVDDFQLKSIRRYGLQATPFLQLLALNSVGIDDDACSALATFLAGHLECLVTLSLTANEIKQVGANAIGTLLTSTCAMTDLDLWQNKLGDEGAIELSLALRLNTTLKTLSLWGNSIGDKGAIELFEALKLNKTLTSLNLRSNEIGDASAETLSAALLPNGTLKHLVLSRNYLGTPALTKICESLKTNSTLETLDIREQGDPPIFTLECKNLLANLLQYNNVLRFSNSDDRFLMKARAGANFLLPGRALPEDPSDSDSDTGTESSDSDAGDVEEDMNAWSKSSWSFARKGLCSMISTAISRVEDHDRAALKQIANSVNSEGQTMLDLILSNGVSAKLEAVKALVYAGFDLNKTSGQAEDSPSYKQLLEQSDDAAINSWANKTKDALEHRFAVEAGQPIYQSSTCKIQPALDYETNRQVVLKVASRRDLSREETIRGLLREANNPYVLTHVSFADHFMALPRVEKTLQDVIETASFIACDGAMIKSVSLSCAKALRFLASKSVAHMDFKPRNVMQVADLSTGAVTYKLTDFDSAAVHGESVDLLAKYSTAYVAPELARQLMRGEETAAGNLEELKVSELFDSWSFGCVVFELFTGEHLLGQKEVPSDNLLRAEDKEELKAWVVFDLVRADKVLNRNTSMDERLKDKAVVADLLGKCLQGSWRRRTGFLNILAHQLFAPDT